MGLQNYNQIDNNFADLPNHKYRRKRSTQTKIKEGAAEAKTQGP